jgi:hypothetical protein
MLYATAIYLLYRSYPNIIDNHLTGFSTLWGQLLSVTTFTLTFFVNQSYALWKKCTELSRRLQGRLHDIGMNMATHAKRQIPENPKQPSTYTPESRQILELMSRYIRMFNLLTYASFTRSHRPILTPIGMRRLVDRGLLTAQEREALVEANIPPTQRHSALLMWMIRLFVEGRASGHILGGHGFEQHTLDKFHIIRAQYGAIGDELQGRMPLAYTHIVQVLVDLILWMYPVMAFSTGMSPFLVIAGTGLLTISYQGLLDLAKQFLDPYDNETYGKGEDPLSVDTLIAETNAGSVRWLYGFEEMPFNAAQIKAGELMDSLLPVRGYTVEDLEQMEEEKMKKEKEMEELRKKENAERLKREAEEESMENDDIADGDANAVPDSQTEPESPVMANATVTKEPASDEVVASVEAEENADDEKPVHKVITVGGKVVSVKKCADDKYVGIVGTGPRSNSNGNLEVANYLSSLSSFAEDEKVPVNGEDETYMTDTAVPNSEDHSPNLASTKGEQPDTSHMEDAKAEAKKMSDEEYDRKLAAIKRAIEDLNESAGPEDKEKVQLAADKKKKVAPKVEEIREEEPKRMTLQDYDQEVERIITEAKEEMLETEAILSTKAGLDPLGWDYDDDELTSIADEPDEDESESKGENAEAREVNSDDEDLDVLGMDIEDDIEVDIEYETNPNLALPEDVEATSEVVPAAEAKPTPVLDARQQRLDDIEKTIQIILGGTGNNVKNPPDPETPTGADKMNYTGEDPANY